MLWYCGTVSAKHQFKFEKNYLNADDEMHQEMFQ